MKPFMDDIFGDSIELPDGSHVDVLLPRKDDVAKEKADKKPAADPPPQPEK